MLALQLGITVQELSEKLSTVEELYWMALYQTDPWGERRSDLRTAATNQLIYNTNAKKPRKFEEFVLFRDKPVQRGDDAKTIRKNFERLIAKQRGR